MILELILLFVFRLFVFSTAFFFFSYTFIRNLSGLAIRMIFFLISPEGIIRNVMKQPGTDDIPSEIILSEAVPAGVSAASAPGKATTSGEATAAPGEAAAGKSSATRSGSCIHTPMLLTR
jgi:hypothetical protein